LRAARACDARVVTSVCVPSWRERYRGIVPARVLGRETPRRIVAWARGLVTGRRASAWLAAIDGKAVGFMALRRQANSRLEVYQLFVLPAFQGSGVGRTLVELSLAEAASRGRRVELWVLRDNARARRWYEARGGRPGRPGRLRWDETTVPMRLYTWPATPRVPL
jgi:ribosomal protein S18 acetylase RimI-like enzyme